MSMSMKYSRDVYVIPLIVMDLQLSFSRFWDYLCQSFSVIEMPVVVYFKSHAKITLTRCKHDMLNC